jgi:hypothetical protein
MIGNSTKLLVDTPVYMRIRVSFAPGEMRFSSGGTHPALKSSIEKGYPRKIDFDRRQRNSVIPQLLSSGYISRASKLADYPCLECSHSLIAWRRIGFEENWVGSCPLKPKQGLNGPPGLSLG